MEIYSTCVRFIKLSLSFEKGVQSSAQGDLSSTTGELNFSSCLQCTFGCRGLFRQSGATQANKMDSPKLYCYDSDNNLSAVMKDGGAPDQLLAVLKNYQMQWSNDSNEFHMEEWFGPAHVVTKSRFGIECQVSTGPQHSHFNKTVLVEHNRFKMVIRQENGTVEQWNVHFHANGAYITGKNLSTGSFCELFLKKLQCKQNSLMYVYERDSNLKNLMKKGGAPDAVIDALEDYKMKWISSTEDFTMTEWFGDLKLVTSSKFGAKKEVKMGEASHFNTVTQIGYNRFKMVIEQPNQTVEEWNVYLHESGAEITGENLTSGECGRLWLRRLFQVDEVGFYKYLSDKNFDELAKKWGADQNMRDLRLFWNPSSANSLRWVSYLKDDVDVIQVDLGEEMAISSTIMKETYKLLVEKMGPHTYKATKTFESGSIEEWILVFHHTFLEMRGKNMTTGETCELLMQKYHEPSGVWRVSEIVGAEEGILEMGLSQAQAAEFATEYDLSLEIQEKGETFSLDFKSRLAPMTLKSKYGEEFEVHDDAFKSNFKCQAWKRGNKIKIVSTYPKWVFRTNVWFGATFLVFSSKVDGLTTEMKYIFEREL